MAQAEQDRRGFAERTGETVRNAGLVVALVGTVAWLASLQIGANLFVAGAAGAGVGEMGRRAAGASNKRK